MNRSKSANYLVYIFFLAKLLAFIKSLMKLLCFLIMFIQYCTVRDFLPKDLDLLCIWPIKKERENAANNSLNFPVFI